VEVAVVWFGVDDKLHGHIKARRAGVAAMGLWALCGSYCTDHLTDGYVAPDVPELIAGREALKLAKRLVTAGLWHVDEARGGWTFHDWADYQVTSGDIRAKRDAAKARMATVRSQRVRANTSRTPREPNANVAGTNDERNAKFAKGSPSPVPDPEPDPRSHPQTPAASGGGDGGSRSWSLQNRIRERSGGKIDERVQGEREKALVAVGNRFGWDRLTADLDAICTVAASPGGLEYLRTTAERAKRRFNPSLAAWLGSAEKEYPADALFSLASDAKAWLARRTEKTPAAAPIEGPTLNGPRGDVSKLRETLASAPRFDLGGPDGDA
jgi:hypothetical protein